MQQQLIAGDTLNFLSGTPGYPASDGWTLNYRMVPRTAGGTAITITAVAEGADHRVQVPANTTATWVADTYGWSAWVENAGGEKYTVQDGQITIKPDPRAMPVGTDTRSQARRALDDARTALAAWTPTTRRYRIGDREREFSSTGDVLKLISHLERAVEAEDRLAGRVVKPGRRIFSRI